MSDQNPANPLDDATSERLARLGSMPTDTSRLDRMIQARIPRRRSRMQIILSLHSVRAMAAAIATIGIIGVIVWSLSGGAVLASPDMMARIHDNMVSGKVNAVRVNSIREANKSLADEWKNIDLPQVPDEHVMMCCMSSIENKRVACVLLEAEGVPVTMAVANAMDMRVPDSRIIQRAGVDYHVQSSGKLNMVMAQRNGRWICLIGEMSPDRLINIAGEIQF